MIITICITLLTLLAALFFLAKVQKENLGNFFKWMSYLVIVTIILMLLYQGYRGASRMVRHKSGTEYSHEKPLNGMHHNMKMKKRMKGHMQGMNHDMCGCCSDGELMDCCMEMRMSEKDTVVREIKKEIIEEK